MALTGLVKHLHKRGLINKEDAEKLIEESRQTDTSQVSLLLKSDDFTPRKISLLISDAYSLPFLDLDSIIVQDMPLNLLPEEFIRSRRVMPLHQHGRTLFIGITDPVSLEAIEQISFKTALSTRPVVIDDDAMKALLDSDMFKGDEAAFDALDAAHLDNIEFDAGESEDDEEEQVSYSDDAPIVRFINKILVDAINSETSDIHFEPYEKFYRIRYRQDGVLREVGRPPITTGARLSSRLKIMARLNITEKRIPQDGRIRLHLSKHRSIDFRVNTLPTLYGEKVVLRILDPSTAKLDIDILGMTDEQNKLYREAIGRPYGMILVTGPTGSGKTVTLYSAMNKINKPGTNISAAEDPVEIPLAGINQVNVNPKVGLTFASALRAFLRQDPDIIMVGEIRDIETAEIAVKAAQTGHLVFSTLHTNDAPQTLTRLANMGLPPYNIAASVLLIMAQRLVRVLCPHCKEPESLPDEVLLEEGFSLEDIKKGINLFKAVGCDKCTEGYNSRTGIFQLLPVNEAMQKMILEGGTTLELDELAETQGVWNLRRSGLEKIKQGFTSLEEINRVTLD
ncbi:type IV-A pilus assembly ATPase PilB [Solemya velum gill symbiont]|uniref:Type IV-A pilus assembly ATPase PilB n=1 Tax=Solemya velum gill symbiont TaxID=2340 RepID=A0A1T2NWE0_SOVGS|nr:type IV-A pilus assembly ATPase PilB [Solemya velum gill symbiont]OOY35945.1 type IV-A pilus assembly ATPase PilB [Solemya velum gill symbiont]OOY38785.1 type IV-A pilus assembly ATPase PilB [Solemya velum gill symbiont]OOY42662.1 type IV-A pilus assembly ATPase PilB [Solemya velum gill symbiont]OOY44115.1 type IV-A pilus assembly ATPase PilB [Solemya velum gill symbiont]OOY48593.1 type IV-A pilus assembly ATPase PilB [Solemya velum gill symbiont]